MTLFYTIYSFFTNKKHPFGGALKYQQTHLLISPFRKGRDPKDRGIFIEI